MRSFIIIILGCGLGLSLAGNFRLTHELLADDQKLADTKSKMQTVVARLKSDVADMEAITSTSGASEHPFGFEISTNLIHE
jgi:hypothetical protein